MGSKDNPGKFDCYSKALSDEPVFVLLARDPDFHRLVNEWADRRERDVMCGDRPRDDLALVLEARQCAREAQEWRRANNGRWRK